MNSVESQSSEVKVLLRTFGFLGYGQERCASDIHIKSLYIS